MTEFPQAAVPPIACDVTALNADQLKRLTNEMEVVYRSATDLRILIDGFAIGIADADAGTFARLAEVVAYDRLCCAFVQHAILAEPQSRTAWLYLSGGPGVKDYIAAELRRTLPPDSKLAGIVQTVYPEASSSSAAQTG